MAPINLTLTVKRPLWLRAVPVLALFAFRVRYWVVGIEPSDAEVDRVVEWYGRHLKIVAR